MRLLLDTHALLWWLDDDPRLGPAARRCIRESEAALVSAATLWEIAIKVGVGKLEADLAAIIDELAPNAFALLPIQPRHTLALAALPRHHRDPFDRMLIAQARCEALSLVTADRRFALYGVDVVACRGPDAEP